MPERLSHKQSRDLVGQSRFGNVREGSARLRRRTAPVAAYFLNESLRVTLALHLPPATPTR